MHVRYVGPGRGQEIRLRSGRYVTARKGELVEVPEEDGRNLVRQGKWVAADADGDEPPEDLQSKTRVQLNEIAVGLGVENPADLANKDEVIAAIEAAQAGKGGDQ